MFTHLCWQPPLCTWHSSTSAWGHGAGGQQPEPTQAAPSPDSALAPGEPSLAPLSQDTAPAQVLGPSFSGHAPHRRAGAEWRQGRPVSNV